MNTWGKYLITSMMATGLIACGQNNPASSSENLGPISTTKQPAVAVKKKAPEKTSVLNIGGVPSIKPITDNLAGFESNASVEKKLIVTKAPKITIDQENLSKLTNLTLDLAKQDLTDERIQIESESDKSPNCVIVAGWMVPGQDQEQYVTFKLNFENNELNFANFERDNLEKIKGIEFNKTLGTTLMCSDLEVKNADDKTILASKIPVTLKVIDSEAVVAAKETMVSKKSERKTKKLNTEAIKPTKKEEVVVQKQEAKQQQVVYQPVPQQNANRKTTVDGVPLQLNKIDQLEVPLASRDTDLFNYSN